MFKNVAADTNVIFYPPPSGKGVRQYVKEHTQTDEARAGKI